MGAATSALFVATGFAGAWRFGLVGVAFATTGALRFTAKLRFGVGFAAGLAAIASFGLRAGLVFEGAVAAGVGDLVLPAAASNFFNFLLRPSSS